MVAHEYDRTDRNETTSVRWIALWLMGTIGLLGFFSIYLYELSGESTVIEVGLGALMVGLLISLTLAAWTDMPLSLASSAVVLVFSVALLTILLPTSGNAYVDALVLFIATTGIVIMYHRTTNAPSIGKTRLKESSVAVVLVLPIILAFAEAMFLGLRFWENFQMGRPAVLFVPLLATWGYLEEALFRGAVQRSMVPLLGIRWSILAAALLNAGFMLFWGSMMYAIFTLLSSILMGYLYLRSRSLMYVGTVHALQDTWMILAFLALGLMGQ